MADLTEYSGPFNPNIKANDFSKETLVELLVHWAKQYIKFEGYYQGAIREHLGDQAANDWACEVYRVDRIPSYIWKGVRRIFNIQGNDLESFFKAIQWDPAFFANLFDWDVEFQGKSRAVVTVTYCPALLAMEKEGKGYEGIICPGLEVLTYETYAKSFNPKIEVKPLVLPPRKSKDDIHCQWEYTLEED